MTTPSDDETGGDVPARRQRGRALRVAALGLLSAAILVALVFFTGPALVWSGQTVHVDFAFAGPIKPGAAVRVSGVVVGNVRRVDLLAGTDPAAGPDKMVRVTARVEDRALPVLTDRARFRVTTLGVLGEHYLDVEPVAGGSPLADGARVDGESLARPDLLLSRASGLLARADDLLPSSPEAVALIQSLARLVGRLDGLLAEGAALQGGLPANDELRGLTADLRAIIRGAAVGIGDGRALQQSISRLPNVLDKTAALEDTVAAAPLLDVGKQEALRADAERTLRSIDVVARRADRLLAVVERREGAAGRLFFDEAVADDLKAVLGQLRQNPLKFLLSPRKVDQ